MMKYGNVLNNMHFLAMVICMRNKTKNSIDAINVGEVDELGTGTISIRQI